MAKFFIAFHNDVAAVVTEGAWLKVRGENFGIGEVKVPRPIFTFTDLEKYPERKRFVTGSMDLMDRLLSGHEFEIRQIYVPFSRLREIGARGSDIKKNELTFVTSADEFVKAFGCMPL